MAKQRRDRVDGAKGLQAVVSDAALPPIDPPVSANLNDSERAIWYVMFDAKARRAWQPQDLTMLVNLCRVHGQIEKLEVLQNSIDPMDDLSGYEKVQKLIDLSVKRFRMICVYLQIHPEATQGKSREQHGQNKAHAAAKGNGEAQQEESLIPRPNTH